MTENKLSYNYGVLQGRIDAVIKYLEVHDNQYIYNGDAQFIKEILTMPIEEEWEEEVVF